MQYIDSFSLASEKNEVDFILSKNHKLNMTCYPSDNNAYPFKIFPQKQLHHLDFGAITMFYGGNGSGKSTLLNVIAEKLKLKRTAPFNNAPLFDEYLRFCDFELTFGRKVPDGSKIIASDDVFDFLLDIRKINEGIDRRREELFDEYERIQNTKEFRINSIDDYEELKQYNRDKKSTKSAFTAKRLPKELVGMSNGESAFSVFTREIKSDALYLLDEPENSLSATLQNELAGFIEDSVRFYNCQFIISTHSPFLLSLKEAKIYDLDTVPAQVKKWTELENVRVYHDFFERHMDSFK
ncbi:MAG: AAA family ATPase [Eubacteriales bacterium]|nr:AAA family ATPase [Eubacteriales bacterium]MDD4475894.1 AAA family ATPase [Eubacteriales bacterium]